MSADRTSGWGNDMHGIYAVRGDPCCSMLLPNSTLPGGRTGRQLGISGRGAISSCVLPPACGVWNRFNRPMPNPTGEWQLMDPSRMSPRPPAQVEQVIYESYALLPVGTPRALGSPKCSCHPLPTGTGSIYSALRTAPLPPPSPPAIIPDKCSHHPGTASHGLIRA